jgi:hypothetical protein
MTTKDKERILTRLNHLIKLEFQLRHPISYGAWLYKLDKLKLVYVMWRMRNESIQVETHRD